MNLADALAPKHFEDGQQIIKQGDNADGMYFVEQGVVKITILNESGREVEVSFFNFKKSLFLLEKIIKFRFLKVNRIPAGGYLGELALVTHKPRAASAYAVGNVKLACEYEPILILKILKFRAVKDKIVLFFIALAVLDVEAFERLLGPCMELMKRNIDDYEDQLIKIFGSKTEISDIR